MTKQLVFIPESEISSNARCKIYPDGSREWLVCSKPCFRPEGWERTGWDKPRKGRRTKAEQEKSAISPNGDIARAMRRARAEVRELALCNPFTWFVTLTLDRSKVDRYDMAAITKRLNVWLDNRVRRKGLAYVLVPERHKDGAIHFHGFFNDALRAVDSGHRDRKGHVVYNLPDWDFGFTTAIRLYGAYSQAVGYVCKYIGKQGEKPGGRWFYSGGALARPEVRYADLDFYDALEQPGAYQFTVDGAGAAFVLFREGGSE